MIKDELRRLLEQVSVMTRGPEEEPWTLRSGRQSRFYLDCRPAVLHPDGMAWAAHLLFDQIHVLNGPPVQFNAVAGPSVGADPLVCGVVMHARKRGFKLPGLFIRKEPKEHGTNKLVEGLKNLEGIDQPSVVLVEDVVTSGGSSLRSIQGLREAGLTCDYAIAIVDRLEGGREALEAEGIEFRSIFTKADFGIEDTPSS
jgi:orotate phosphoribosyltransferase